MNGKYDKILKENLEEIFLPLAKKILRLKFDTAEEIPDDLQYTKELKPDFLKRILHEDSTQNYILHIEFQTKDDKRMHKRMLKYYSMLYDKYDLHIYQIVFYLGRGESKMIRQLNHRQLKFKYKIVELNKIPYKRFLNSNIPEEFILAILADFQNTDKESVISKILTKIESSENGTFYKHKIVTQLDVISSLRDLQLIVQKLTDKIMAFDYDIKKDLRYKQGKKEGKEEGLEKMILALLKDGKYSLEEIAKISGLSLDKILLLKKTLKTN